jgi:hypothetical protein
MDFLIFETLLEKENNVKLFNAKIMVYWIIHQKCEQKHLKIFEDFFYAPCLDKMVWISNPFLFIVIFWRI